MTPARENGIFDDVIITSTLHSDKLILKANFTFLVKRITEKMRVAKTRKTMGPFFQTWRVYEKQSQTA